MQRFRRRTLGLLLAIVAVAGVVAVGVWYAGRQPALPHVPAVWIPLAQQEAVELARLPEVLRGRRIVLVGEHHGLVEPTETVKGLLAGEADPGFTHLAVEWYVSDQSDLERYLAGDDALLGRFLREKGDAVTVEYFSVWSFVRERNRARPQRTIAVRLIDPPRPKIAYVEDGVAHQRDRHMLEQVEQVLRSDSNNRVLVYCGALHAAKCGEWACPTKEGSKDQVPTLGAMLCDRDAASVASVRVLAPADPMWKELARAKAFTGPVAIRLTMHWPELGKLVFCGDDYPDPASASKCIAHAYDYVVWWPTSRPGIRAR